MSYPRLIKNLAVLLSVLLSSQLNADTTVRYQVERYDAGSEGVNSRPTEQHEWLLWKYANNIQLQQADASSAVIWSRMQDGSLQRKEVYPSFKTIVSYQPGDAAALGLHDRWEESVALFDGGILASLKIKGEKQLSGHKGVLYEGAVHGRQYRVLWQPQAKLPAFIQVSNGRSEARITLIESFDPDRVKRYPRPAALDDYDDIDYADIGDNEAHPLVQALRYAERHSEYYPGH